MIKARYTVVLKSLLDEEKSRKAIDKALSFYPLYHSDKLYDLIPTREELNTKLLNHYKYREIGFETPGRFIDELQITMNEIMPRYNELFKTVVTMAELPSPFDNVDVIETFEQETTGNVSRENTTETSSSDERTVEGTSSNTTTSKDNSSSDVGMNANSKTVESETPQGYLSVPASDIEGVNYADKVTWNKNESDSHTDTSGESESTGTTTNSETNSSSGEMNGTSNTTEETTGTVKHTYTKIGNQGVNTYAHDMNEFRTSIIDVVDMIINDNRISELFMMVY